MINYDDFFNQPLSSYLDRIKTELISKTNAVLTSNRFGDRPKWDAALNALPVFDGGSPILNQDSVSAVSQKSLSAAECTSLEQTLRGLMPWRKGPYQLDQVFIDTEWRSDAKWRRIQEHVGDLSEQIVLDVGCGNGYHCFRMLGAGAKMVVGIDPMLFYVYQFFALNHFLKQTRATVLPLAMQDFPDNSQCFDWVFSMGVLYHRRSPIDHLIELKRCLKPGGTLILETLIVTPEYGDCLVPENRYAKMRNVWFLPSINLLSRWLTRVGFRDIQLLDESDTTIEEQRATSWMQYESLETFLNPNDHSLTVEGYPAPRRAVLKARL